MPCIARVKEMEEHTPRCSHVGTSRPGLSSQQGEVRQGVGPVQPGLPLLLLHLPAVHVDPRGGADGDGDPGRGGSLPPSPLEAVSLATNQLDRAGHPDSPLLSPPPASGPCCWSTLRTQVWIASCGRDYKGRRLQRWNLERRKFYFICFQYCRQ